VRELETETCYRPVIVNICIDIHINTKAVFMHTVCLCVYMFPWMNVVDVC
jgi:hypothetical protein